MLLGSFQKIPGEAGCDEAGRGSLVGAVFAAAVILPNDFFHKGIKDSKQLNFKNREKMRILIEKESIAYSVKNIEVEMIDRVNVLQATIMAMHASIEGLNQKPSYLLVDGNYFKSYPEIPHSCMVKGDSRFMSIAAASILAKTYRDEYMNTLNLEYPMYNWKQNKGYGTLKHRKAIHIWGMSPYHRKSFRLKEINNHLA
jgi:ribonuclease HII